MADWALFGLLTDERLGPGFDHQQRTALASLVHEIRRRGRQASQFPELVSEGGKPKAGRNKVLAPGQIDEKVACERCSGRMEVHTGKAPVSELY